MLGKSGGLMGFDGCAPLLVVSLLVACSKPGYWSRVECSTGYNLKYTI